MSKSRRNKKRRRQQRKLRREKGRVARERVTSDEREASECVDDVERRQFEIVLPAGMHDEIRRFLFDDPRCEQLGVILAGVSHGRGTTKLLGRQFVGAGRGDLLRQSRGGIAADPEFSRRLMRQCASEGLSQIDVHSHPFGPDPGLSFSGTDDAHEREMARYVYRHLPSTYYASLVMNQKYARARIWLPDNGSAQATTIDRMTLVEWPYRHVDLRGQQTPQKQAGTANDMFDRHVRAFGADGQARMREAAVAVIGAGGLGSIMIEGLTRLGVGAIHIIEPDAADITNLNRVIGMTHSDALAKRPKAVLAARMVRDISPDAHVAVHRTTVFDPSLVDVLKQSDLLVAATDNPLLNQLIALAIVLWLVGLLVALTFGRAGAYLSGTPYGAQRWCLRRAIGIIRFVWRIGKALACWGLVWLGNRIRRW